MNYKINERRHGTYVNRRINRRVTKTSKETRGSTSEPSDTERRTDVEAENNRRETRRRYSDERNERQVETYDNTGINRRAAKTSKEARRLQNEPSEKLRNTRKDIKRRTYVETENNRSETRRRSNDERTERQVVTYRKTGINSRVAKTSKEARKLQNEPSEVLRSAGKTRERRTDVEAENNRSGIRSDDERNERQFEIYDNTRISRDT